ncbi:3-deoxy-8-phosphooctulonate synthase [Alphaproteobacteria bacterium]|nr:3-deoxy-8-phosphooctulonate synthase [Alphaproteobacteria bacterium]
MQNNNKSVKIKNFEINNLNPFILIAGPCAIESKDHAFDMAAKIKEICMQLEINFIYKSSFDKANRTSIASSRGIGIEEGLKIFASIKKELDISVITDVHEKEQCEEVASVVDILQIPAFLCRQTDLLTKAALTGKAVMVKKGQFLAPWEMSNIVNKLNIAGCSKIILCERGTSFGYNNLVSDMRSIPIMQKTGWPVIFDATHSVQEPGGLGASSGGKRQYVPYLAKASVAVGVSGIFIETHQDPDNAPSDGPNMLNIIDLKKLLQKLKQIDNIVK